MRNQIFIILVLFVALSCKKTIISTPVKEDSTMISKEEPLYTEDFHKVTSIKKIDSVYVIYTQSKGDRYKIITKKSNKIDNCIEIKPSEIYDLDLTEVFKDDDVYSPQYDGFEFNGVIINLNEDIGYKLNYANNISGLCYIEGIRN